MQFIYYRNAAPASLDAAVSEAGLLPRGLLAILTSGATAPPMFVLLRDDIFALLAHMVAKCNSFLTDDKIETKAETGAETEAETNT